MSIISRGVRIFRDEGPVEFLQRSAAFVYRDVASLAYQKSLRRFAPSVGYYTENSIRVKEKRMFDDILLPYRSDVPEKEDGIVSSHHEVTESGDRVVVIGGGNGITAVSSALLVGEYGEVTIYEGGRESVEKIIDVVNMNGVSGQCEVYHAVIGKERNVYGGDSTTADVVGPDEIPDCDVLELDCEGSEIDILSELSIRPRAIIAELHPWLFQEEPDNILDILSELGYKIVHRFGHDGTSLSKTEFNTLLSNSNIQGERYVESGGRWPVVIAAVRTDD